MKKRPIRSKQVIHLNEPIPPMKDWYNLLYQLLPVLEGAGFVLSPDRYIRLYYVLGMLPDEALASDLGPYLCPIFATSFQQQESFYKLFARSIAEISQQEDFKSTAKQDTVEINTSPPSEKRPDQTPTPESPSNVSGQEPLAINAAYSSDPPYFYDITPDEDIHISQGADYQRTLIRFRSREIEDWQKIDWHGTLNATASQAGMLHLRFQQQSRPAEYLLLIESHSAEDHRSLLFDYLYKNLKNEAVLIERFFHDGDLRHCFNEQYPKGITLHELRYKYSSAKLLVLGSGYQILSARTGALAQWADQYLPSWRLRFLLTGVERKEWGRREFQLKQMFNLLPASWDALRYISEFKEPIAKYADLPDYVKKATQLPTFENIHTLSLIHDLEQHFQSFPRNFLYWIAACALWPTLHFKLTLNIGRKLSSDEHPLITIDKVARLSALPWFTHGFIPKEERKILLYFLESEAPDTLRACAGVIFDLLSKKAPEVPESYAFSEYSVQLALFDVLKSQAPSEESIKKLRAQLRRLNGDGDITDLVLPQWLEKELKTSIKNISSHPIRLLIIDDELEYYQIFREFHQSLYEFDFYHNPDHGLEEISRNEYDAVLMDLHFSRKHTYEWGLSYLVPEAIRRANKRFPVIVATSDNRNRTRKIAMQQGAAELLRKDSYDVIGWHQAILHIIQKFHEESTNTEPENVFLVFSAQMLVIKENLQKLALQKDKPVLIIGENGVGKETAAKFIHSCGLRNTSLFEKINMASYTSADLENELLGHTKGVFSDTKDERIGYLEKIGAGTLFLDEIGEVTLATQVMLLRVLENREFTPVGSTISQPLRAHLIFGTNKDLDAEVAQKEFREDFYERISQLYVHIPPLRERREEIIPFCRYFLEKRCGPDHLFFGKTLENCFTKELITALQIYNWPTNIRQLRDTIDHLLSEAQSNNLNVVDTTSLPEVIRQTLKLRQFPVLGQSISDVPSSEQWSVDKQNAYNTLQTIEQTLKHSQGALHVAATTLGMGNARSLEEKVKSILKKYPDFSENLKFQVIQSVFKDR